jgi:type IV secretion system protein VirB1
MLDFITLAQQCAPLVDPHTMAAIVRVESDFNPYAIGVVHGRLVRQPRNLAEALATAHSLDAQGYAYSVGLAQVKRSNLSAARLSLEGGFEPCTNLAAGARILSQCFTSAHTAVAEPQQALRIAFSCYYSGNASTGFSQGYVQKVVAAAGEAGVAPIPLVPAVRPTIENVHRGANTAGQPERPPNPVKGASEAATVTTTPIAPTAAPASSTRNPEDASVF